MSYYDKIYELVRCIPAGRCASYGHLALLSGRPRAARVVGSALRLCRDPSVPCHRVLRSDGSVTCAFPPELRRAMLEAEGGRPYLRRQGGLEPVPVGWRAEGKRGQSPCRSGKFPIVCVFSLAFLPLAW